jgi:tRNA-specific 2-thiouridylase
MNLRSKRIFVGLSGGVDSAVTAALLQKSGAEVTGVFIKGWYPPGMPCTWAEDRRDAMRVAAHLGIPFHTLDAADEYKKGVIDYLLSEYKAGRTPNPDIMCNREVKFGAYYEFAKKNGADFIATGHYAQAVHTEKHSVQMQRGIDESKDQSYFLWAIPQEALDMTIFPLGGFEKTHVRTLAKKFALPVAEKKDSQGICFLGSISVEEFLRHEFGTAPGIARSDLGEEIGVHDGALLHTLGERIALANAAPGPWYVIGKDIEANELIVSSEISQTRPVHEIDLTQTNWFSMSEKAVEAQYRYHGPRISGTLTMHGNRFSLDTPLTEPVAQGQSLVLYDGSKCLGGGIIA